MINFPYRTRLLIILVFTITMVLDVDDGYSTSEKVSNKKTEMYENGVKKSEVNLIDGKKFGISINWYSTGCPMSIHHFNNDVLSGPMIKWENCEDIIAIAEYQDGLPWNGYFLVNPATAIPITDTIVHESDFTCYVIKFTHGQSFTGLTKEMLEQHLKENLDYKKLLERVK